MVVQYVWRVVLHAHETMRGGSKIALGYTLIQYKVARRTVQAAVYEKARSVMRARRLLSEGRVVQGDALRDRRSRCTLM